MISENSRSWKTQALPTGRIARLERYLLRHPGDNGLVVFGATVHAQAPRLHGVKAFGHVFDRHVAALLLARLPHGLVTFFGAIGNVFILLIDMI